MKYDRDCVLDRSMPFWCVANPLGDPFGGPVMPHSDSLETAKLIAWAAQEGYCEATGAHDDDLVPWDPAHPEDDLDPQSAVYERLHAIKAVMDAAGVIWNTATCCLHGNPIFRDGGLANPDPAVRELARLKVERSIRIGHLFGARHFVYWVARDGFEVPVVTQWAKVYDWIAEALNHAWDYIHDQKFTCYEGATIEPKPNEPRGQMFLPTSGHAVGFILGKLKHPEFFGVNPELLQHEGMTLLNSVMTVSYLTSLNKLQFLHFGSQIKGQFDNDFPPLIGPEGLKETVMMFYALDQIGWKGTVEFDCHMLRAEGDPQHATAARKQFIVNCVRALDMALTLAKRIQPPAHPEQQAASDLDSICQICQLSGCTGKR